MPLSSNPDAIANEIVQFLRTASGAVRKQLQDAGCMPLNSAVQLLLYLLNFDTAEATDKQVRRKLRKTVVEVVGSSTSVPFDKIAEIISATCTVTLCFEHMVGVRQQLGMRLQYDDVGQEQELVVAASVASTPSTTALVPLKIVEVQHLLLLVSIIILSMIWIQ